MTRERDLESTLDEWFADGPTKIADRVIDDALRTIDHTRQARGGVRLARYTTMNGTWRLAAVAVAAVAVLAIGAGLLTRNSLPPIGGPSVSPSPSASPSPTPTAAPSPSPSIQALVEGDSVYPGVYRSKFDPPFTLTIGDQVQNGCAVGFRCRGTVDVNSPSWVAIEFGNDPPEHPRMDVMAFRLDKVIDVAHPGRLIDPPADLVAWLSKVPGLTVLSQKPVTVGGLPATQLDVRAGSKGVTFGPIPGISDPQMGMGANHTSRMFVLLVNGRHVIIWISSDEEGSAHFPTMALTMQPLIDSIVWP